MLSRISSLSLSLPSIRTFTYKVTSILNADPKPSDKKLEKKSSVKKVEKLASEGSIYGTGRTRDLDLSISPTKVVSKLASKSELKKIYKKEKIKNERLARINKLNLTNAMKKDTANNTDSNEATKDVKKGMNLYQLCLRLPNDGVGLRVYRDMMARYEEPSYWNIVKVTKPTV